MIGYMVRNFISTKASVALNIYKTLKRIYDNIEYHTQAPAPVLVHRNWSIILRMENMQRRETKVIKRVKDYSYWERLEKLGLTNLLERRKRGNLIETFKIINWISWYSLHFFDISPRTGNLPTRKVSKTKSKLDQLDFFANWGIYPWKKMPNQFENINSVDHFTIKLDNFGKNCKKKI